LNDREIYFNHLVNQARPLLHEFGQMVNDAGGIGDALVVFVFVNEPMPELVVDDFQHAGLRHVGPNIGRAEALGMNAGDCDPFFHMQRHAGRDACPHRVDHKFCAFDHFFGHDHTIGRDLTFAHDAPGQHFSEDPMRRVAFQGFRRVRLRVSLVHGDPKAAQFPSPRPGGRKD
jgi:hypothetical protein